MQQDCDFDRYASDQVILQKVTLVLSISPSSSHQSIRRAMMLHASNVRPFLMRTAKIRP